jgi:hypothetical protein
LKTGLILPETLDAMENERPGITGFRGVFAFIDT